jgi:hypothetical protein
MHNLLAKIDKVDGSMPARTPPQHGPVILLDAAGVTESVMTRSSAMITALLCRALRGRRR